MLTNAPPMWMEMDIRNGYQTLITNLFETGALEKFDRKI
jgi:hypothetical protein